MANRLPLLCGKPVPTARLRHKGPMLNARRLLLVVVVLRWRLAFVPLIVVMVVVEVVLVVVVLVVVVLVVVVVVVFGCEVNLSSTASSQVVSMVFVALLAYTTICRNPISDAQAKAR